MNPLAGTDIPGQTPRNFFFKKEGVLVRYGLPPQEIQEFPYPVDVDVFEEEEVIRVVEFVVEEIIEVAGAESTRMGIRPVVL